MATPSQACDDAAPAAPSAGGVAEADLPTQSPVPHGTVAVSERASGLRRYTRGRRRDQRGVEMVEFAIVALLLFTIVLGLIDFGWAFSQNLSVKHAAREGARLASVDAEADSGNTTTNCTGTVGSTGTDELIALIKQRVSSELSSSRVTVSVSFANGVAGNTGDTGSITVTYPLSSLSGFTKALIGGTMSSTVQFRMEQNENWLPTGQSTCP